MLYKTTSSALLLLFICLGGHCQKVSRTIIYSKQVPGTSVVDTNHYVYIEHDANAECYERLSLTAGVAVVIREFSKQSKYMVRPLKTVAGDFPVHWCRVPLLYKGALYLYAPCDWYVHSITSIAANAIIHGPESDPYVDTNIAATTRKGTTLKIKYKSRAGVEGAPIATNVYIIDSTNNIAVFEEVFKDRKNEYQLMIDVRHIRALPAIVYHCKGSKVTEYRGEKDGHYIDFPETIKQSKVVIGNR